MKRNKRDIKIFSLGFIVCLILLGGVYVYASNLISGSVVSYDNSDSGLTSTNVNGAINELYALLKKNNLGATYVAPASTDTHKGVVYLDPINLSNKCDLSNSRVGTGTTGCMKWYIFDDTGDYYKMILDHNTTAKIAYNTSDSNSSPDANFTKALNDLVDVTGWTVTPRLITANEIATITGKTSKFNLTTTTSSEWFYLDAQVNSLQTQVAKSKGASKYSWLYDYTYDCESRGCNIKDSSTYGSWTNDKTSGSSSKVWILGRDGGMYTSSANGTDYGIRPVISVAKKLFE